GPASGSFRNVWRASGPPSGGAEWVAGRSQDLSLSYREDCPIDRCVSRKGTAVSGSFPVLSASFQNASGSFPTAWKVEPKGLRKTFLGLGWTFPALGKTFAAPKVTFDATLKTSAAP